MDKKIKKNQTSTSPLRVVFIYTVFAVSWILLSDYLLSLIISDSSAMLLAQNLKGVFFVLITAILLSVLIRSEMKIRDEYEKKLQKNAEEKEILLREVHHRVRNNTQLLDSLINIQQNLVSNEDTKMALTKVLNKVRALSLVHSSVYNTERLDTANVTSLLVTMLNRRFRASRPEHEDLISVTCTASCMQELSILTPLMLLFDTLVDLIKPVVLKHNGKVRFNCENASSFEFTIEQIDGRVVDSLVQEIQSDEILNALSGQVLVQIECTPGTDELGVAVLFEGACE